MNSNKKSALILGGSSLIGKNIITKFTKSSPYWNVVSIDFRENLEAYKNIIIPKDFTKINFTSLRNAIDEKFDIIINVNSYFKKANIERDDIFDILELYNNSNISSSIFASYLAKKYLNPNSLLILMGSKEVNDSSSKENILYKMTKNSVHDLTNALVKNQKELPDDTKIITLLT